MVYAEQFSDVPVINITSSNIAELWPSLVLALKTSTFVAVDTELSGLGNRRLLGVRSLPERYKNLCEVAKTRSVLSVGLSCFKLQKVEQTVVSSDTQSSSQVPIKQWSYNVQTFNVVLLCSEDYMVEPGALKFLVEHGFDFNKQYSSGVSYYRGKDTADKVDKTTSKSKSKSSSGPTARHLLDILLWSKAPLVLHNGFIDLVFIYQNFYTDLPPTLQVFLADLAEMFPNGILDTKYAVEFIDRQPATYLEYVFRKWQRKNTHLASSERRQVCVEFGQLPSDSTSVTHSHCSLPTTCVEMGFIPKATVLLGLVCQSFAGHGWCGKGKECPKSHAIDLILDLHGIKAAKGRKRRHRQREQQQQRGEDGILKVSETPDDSKRIRLDKSMEDSGDLSEVEAENSSNSSLENTSITDSVDDTAKSKGTEETVKYDEITDAYLKSSLQLEKGRSGGHRAGFDAFMTGYIMACILSKSTSVNETERVVGAGIKMSQLSGAEAFKDKIYATGKDQPLSITKSNFCNTSKNHRERMQQIK